MGSEILHDVFTPAFQASETQYRYTFFMVCRAFVNEFPEEAGKFFSIGWRFKSFIEEGFNSILARLVRIVEEYLLFLKT